MQTFLIEGSSSTEQRLPFSIIPSGGFMKKTNTLPISPVRKALFFFCTECGRVSFQLLPVDQVIFCPTHKYKRLYT